MSRRFRLSHVLLAALLGAASSMVCRAQQPPAPAPQPGPDIAVDRRDVMIPMRDGVRLFTVILTMKTQAKAVPIMMTRTPYGVSQVGSDGYVPVAQRELAADGYVFVHQDIRGRGKSEGQFVMNRHQDPQKVDESTDTYDTIDWLLKNVPNTNGRVGVMGVSYPGWLAGVAAVNPHPALKAVSPQAPMTDTWMGDDFFHQGAFRQTFGFEYANSMEGPMSGARPARIDRYDHYDWYLQYLTLTQLADANDARKLPSWQAFSQHPTWDVFWRTKAMDSVLATPTVPVLTVGGFWDQEDMYGPIAAYKGLEPDDAQHWNHLVMGPWFHGGWSRPGGDAIGAVKFGSNTSDYFRQVIQRPWFAYYLHGTGEGRFPEAWIFESGADRWRTFDRWPPRRAAPGRVLLGAGGRLTVEVKGSDDRWRAVGDTAHRAPVTGGAPYDEYVSDPAHPVPYMPRPIDGTKWREWLVQDQRFVHNRPDVLSWESAPLQEDVVIAGDVIAHLYASTTGTDADWVVKLIDVYPDSVADDPRMGGYQLMVNADILRGRYHKGFTKATPIPANTVTHFRSNLQQQLHRFRAGHRIMVQVQSSWFPLYDRNPQTFVPSLFEAKPSDFKARTHRVWHTAQYPSHVEVGILPP